MSERIKRIKIDEDSLINLYVYNKLSTIKIAKIYGCASSTINRRLNYFEIKLRRNSDYVHTALNGKNNPNWKGGLPKCVDCNKKLSRSDAKRCKACMGKYISGENHPRFGKRYFGSECARYKDGRTPVSKAIRRLKESEYWKTTVFERDNFTCQECGVIGGNLEAHHNKPFAVILSEFLKEYDQFSPIEDKETLIRLAINYKPFWDLENGTTLCKGCHNDLRKVTLDEIKKEGECN